RIRRGYHPERSGEIQIVPRLPAVVASWLSHAGPWDHVQRVPLFLYGPGHVPAVGRVDRPVTLADLAPTLARILGTDFQAPDGRPLREAVAVADPPRLILTMIWDSAGRNVLDEHPEAWPTLRALIPGGAWFEEATVGTSPSTTPAVHATIGTGAFPSRHGLVDLHFRWGGRMAQILDERPAFLSMPTLADRYAASTGQAAKVGLIASLGTLGLIGHGASIEGGGRHLVAMHNEGVWGIGEAYAEDFRFPAYLHDVRGLTASIRRLDLEDDAVDGRWLGEPVLTPGEDLSFSPAWAEHQTRILEEVVEREGFGRDAVPDLLFTNYKQVDAVGHRWGMHGPQMEAVVRSSDTALRTLMAILDREVGEGEWVLALTADHGSIPDPAGAPIIDLQELRRDLAEAFGAAVEQVRPTQVWVDERALASRGATLEDVAELLGGYRRSDNHELPPGEPDTRLFAAAFPSEVLLTASCVPSQRGAFG
ncbi:MAG TPA: alkaline phosphatase family protein, partial [Actinomycetota bacterium]